MELYGITWDYMPLHRGWGISTTHWLVFAMGLHGKKYGIIWDD